MASDVRRWHEITGEQDTPPESGPADEEAITYTEAELDSSCRYGEEGPHTSTPRPHRDPASATGLHTFDDAPAQPLCPPHRPIQLHLTPDERRTIAAQLRCPPWEIGPCIGCATPIHRYGPRSPLACPTCCTTTRHP